jgi:N-acetylglucosamine-6-phosphate deacetylase
MGLRITNGHVVLPGDVRDDVDVLVDGSTIAGIVYAGDGPASTVTLDAAGSWVTAGLIDLHVHGGSGVTFNSADQAERILEELCQHGITTALPTLATMPLDDMLESIRYYSNRLPHWKDGAVGARAAQLHLEGPFLSPAQCGAHPAEWLRVPGDGSGLAILEAADTLGIVTLAPELEGALGLARGLSARGVRVSVGHSNADSEILAAGVEAGLRHAAHLWSGQSTAHRSGAWRVSGVLEFCLASDVLTGEVIGDGHHLSGELLRVAYRCLRERLCLVSDACAGAGLAEGAKFTLMGRPCRIVDGAAVVEDAGVFAGSTTFLNEMVPITSESAGLDVVNVLAMATVVPANILGRTDIGRLRAGACADIAVFDTKWKCLATVVNGDLKWSVL